MHNIRAGTTGRGGSSRGRGEGMRGWAKSREHAQQRRERGKMWGTQQMAEARATIGHDDRADIGYESEKAVAVRI